MAIKLMASTNIRSVDELLQDFIERCEATFPTRVRSYYLGGSYSDGTGIDNGASPNSSDADVFVLFRGIVTEDETAMFQQIVTESRLVSPISLDTHAYSEQDLLSTPEPEATQLSFLDALIKHASVLIYGEDIRTSLPSVPFSHYVLDVIESGIYHIGIPRQRIELAYPLPTPLNVPLVYPDADGEFYGYDSVPSRPATPPATRVLVGIATWIATFILALETGHYAGQKSQSVALCKKYLPDDERIQLVTSIYDNCKLGWRYNIPDGKEDRELLRALCGNVLALENEYLQICHDFMLEQLRHDGDVERQVARILESIVY